MSDTTSQPESLTKPLGWKISSNGQYFRLFDPFEQWFSSLCHDPARPGFRSLDVVASIRFDNSPVDDNTFLGILKGSWARMRYIHPTLGTEVGQMEFRYTPLTSQADVDAWVEKTFVVKEWESNAEVGVYEDLGIAPVYDTPMLYYFPEKKKLIFRANHMYGDAQSAVALLQDLFAEMQCLQSGGERVNESWGAEVQNLARGGLNAAGITELEDSSLLSLISRLPQPRADRAAFEIPTLGKTHTPQSGKTQSLDFSPEQTSELLKHAKKMNLGITSFIHAALLHAGKRVSPMSDSTIHSTLLIFSFRETCLDLPLNANSKAAALRIGFWPIQVPISHDLQDTASRVKKEYQALARQKSDALAAMVPYLQRWSSGLSRGCFDSILPSFIGNVSNAFPKTYGSFKIRDFWMAAMPTNELIYLGIQTFNNRLSIRACYNKAYHTDEQITKYLLHIRKEVYSSIKPDVKRPSVISMGCLKGSSSFKERSVYQLGRIRSIVHKWVRGKRF